MPKLCVYEVWKVFLLNVVRNRLFLFGHYSVTWAYGLNLDVHYSVLWALTAKQFFFFFWISEVVSFLFNKKAYIWENIYKTSFVHYSVLWTFAGSVVTFLSSMWKKVPICPSVHYSVRMYTIVYQKYLRERCLLSPKCILYTVVYTSYLSLWKRYSNFLEIKNDFLANIYNISKFEPFLRTFFFWARKG